MAIEKLIFWDIDGTLVHCGSDGTTALNRTFFDLFGIDDAFNSSNIGGAMDFMILQNIMETHSIEEGKLEKIVEYYSKVLSDLVRENKTKRILPGVSEIIEKIHKDKAIENALLTSNLKIGAMIKLESLGLDTYFDKGGFGDKPGEKWDAAEESLREIEDEFGVKLSKDQIYIVGDSIYDIECAKRIGMTSIAVGTGWTDESSLKKFNPDYYFHDLSDTEKVYQALGIN